MTKIKMAAINRKYIYNTCIFELQTAKPMLLRSDNTARVLIRMTDVRFYEKSKMAAINRK